MKDFWTDLLNFKKHRGEAADMLSNQVRVMSALFSDLHTNTGWLLQRDQAVQSNVIAQWSNYLLRIWKQAGRDSEMSFDILLRLLEICLNIPHSPNQHFCAMADVLQQDLTVFMGKMTCSRRQQCNFSFAALALRAMIESDNLHKTDYVDTVLLYLSTRYIRTGQPVLSEFIQSVPFFSGFYLRQHEKLFQV